MFGINGAELLVLLFVFLVILGPKGLQEALRGFKNAVGWARSFSQKLREESKVDLSATGLSEIDWSEFDFSEYDPREIIRQAVREEMDAWVEQAKSGGAPISGPGAGTARTTTPPPSPPPATEVQLPAVRPSSNQLEQPDEERPGSSAKSL